jgi:competence protein ComEC
VIPEILDGKPVLGISAGAFQSKGMLKKIYLPAGLRFIAATAFEACSSLKEIHIPASLETVDMKAFSGCKKLSDVWYEGTKEQWSRVRISTSSSENALLLKASIHCSGKEPDADALNDVKKKWFSEDVRYLLSEGFFKVSGGTFGSDENETGLDILNVLYDRSGNAKQYRDASDWAEKNGIAGADFSGAFTVGELAQVLFKTAVYNGFMEKAGTGAAGFTGEENLSAEQAEALRWADQKGYLKEIKENLSGYDVSRKATRAVSSSVLAAYLKSDDSSANRASGIYGRIQELLKDKGDGKMHVIALNLNKTGLSGKTGDSSFLIFPDGKTMMIDTGYGKCSDLMKDFLKKTGLSHLDYFVISHPHSDHIGNALLVLNTIYENGGTVGHFLYTGLDLKSSTTDDKVQSLLTEKGCGVNANVRAGDSFRIGEVDLKIYNPEDSDLTTASSDQSDKNVNQTSLAMKFTFGTSTYLTCGDLYAVKERSLAAEYGDALQADVIKANHHGTYTSSSMQWINTVKPSVVLAECDDIGSSENWRRFSGAGASYYNVGLDGMIMVDLDNAKGYTVTTQYDSFLREPVSRQE